MEKFFSKKKVHCISRPKSRVLVHQNTKKSCSKDHPRGSPPLTRGIRETEAESIAFLGVTPAYAGNIYQFVGFACHIRDHPRLRGEHSNVKRYPVRRMGSPPLTRGTWLRALMVFSTIRITPAYAGNISTDSNLLQLPEDHPRLRGEHTKKIS